MDAIRAPSSATAAECRAVDPMVKSELEAAEALAELAHLAPPPNNSDSRVNESLSGRVQVDSNGGNSWFDPVDSFHKSSNNLSESEGQKNFGRKTSKKRRILTAKSLKNEHSIELRLNSTLPTNCPSSSGRKSRQSLTEAEKEARKIRRVLANRESARQTIRRRQAIYKELITKAADLEWENEDLKRKKEMASQEYSSLKSTNECLKAQVVKVEAQEKIHEEQNETYNKKTPCSSSANQQFIICNQPPYFPFVWPSDIKPTALPNRIMFSSNVPIELDSPSIDKRTSMVNGGISPLYFLPCPWLFALPQNHNEHHPRSFNLNQEPKECSPSNHTATSSTKIAESLQLFPQKVKEEASFSVEANQNNFPPDGGGGGQPESNIRDKASTPMHLNFFKSEAVIEHGDSSNILVMQQKTDDFEGVSSTNGERQQLLSEIYSSKKFGVDMAAAAEARKRRKELKNLKNLHLQQLRMR